MEKKELIQIEELCTSYEIEISFFYALENIGLIEIETIESTPCIFEEAIGDVEKMIRLHHELEVNVEGIDVVFNLLKKVDDLKNQLVEVQSRLEIYETIPKG